MCLRLFFCLPRLLGVKWRYLQTQSFGLGKSKFMAGKSFIKTKESVTGRINATALELLKKNPQGLRWSELSAKIKESDRSFHPKTVNGCVWKLIEKFPDQVYKPEKGLFRLRKYKSGGQRSKLKK